MFYDLSQHYRAPQPSPDLSAYARQYQAERRSAQMQSHAQQNRPQNIRREFAEEEEEITHERMRRLKNLRQKAKRAKSRHFVYSTYEENGKKFIAFERPAFITLILLMSIGIGVLAIDARRFMHFIGHTIRKSFSAVTN